MAFTEQDFTMWAGETKYINIVVEDSQGNPLDIEGLDDAIWVLQKSILRDTPALVKTLHKGITIKDAEQGLLQILLVPKDTKNLSGFYYHEAEITDAFDHTSVILTGRVRINPSVTNV